MPSGLESRPFFSIIIPTYNSAADIRKCLESITRQDFKNFEVIVQDGLSADGTVEMIEQIRTENPSIDIQVSSEKDNGVYDAMNKAVLRSKGDWLCFLGSDDQLFESDTLKRVFSLPLNADIVYGNVKMLHSHHIYNGPFTLGKILFEGNICHQAIFYKRSVFDRVGVYNLAYKIYADYDFNIRCFLNKQISKKYIGGIITLYNENDGLTGRNTPDMAFHNKREEYRQEFLQTLSGKWYPYSRKFRNILEKMKHKLSQF